MLRHSKIEREMWQLNFEHHEGYEEVPGKEAVMEVRATVLVPVVEGKAEEQIRQPGALIDMTRYRDFVREDPGAACLLDTVYPLDPSGRFEISHGFCFLRHEGEAAIYDMKNTASLGDRLPPLARHFELPLLMGSKKTGTLAGEMVSARGFLADVTAQFGDADIEKCFGEPAILECVRTHLVAELTETIHCAPVRDKVEIYRQLAAGKEVKKFTKADAANGLVADLFEDALCREILEMTVPEMARLEAALPVPPLPSLEESMDAEHGE